MGSKMSDFANQELPIPDTPENHSVSYVAESPEHGGYASVSTEYLSILEAKAAKWDAIAPDLLKVLKKVMEFNLEDK